MTTAPDHGGDVQEEQRYLGRLLDRLQVLRDETRQALDRTLRAGGGTPQARSERESFVRLYTDELRAYAAADLGLYFGRLDMDDGDVRRIGRVGLRDDDEDLTPLLLDWRAENSRPFYLATTARPEGAHRRRHLRTIGRRVVGLHDEYLTAPADGRLPEDHDDVVGESALLAALDAARSGTMTDIVATIQREQDEIIRNPHRGVLVVQGGPGTGKTAVALHRAAYLLYTHRRQLDRSGVLIVGPNPRFLDYIARVLPSLGESGVVLRTLADLYPGVRARGTESLRGQEVKGSADMVGILRAAVRARQLAPDTDVPVRCEGLVLTITPAMVRSARGRARMTRRPHNRAREVFRSHVVETLAAQYEAALADPVADAEAAAWNPGPDGAGDLGDPGRPMFGAEDRDAMREEVAGAPEVCEALDRWWPVLRPETVLAELLGDPGRVAEAAGDYVEEDQQALVRADGADFSPADVPLLDELAELLGDAPGEDAAAAAREWDERLRQAEEALEILSGSAGQDVVDEDDPEILMAYDVVDAETLARRHRADDDLTVADRAAADRDWAYGHVIVDEAQELSPMAWRMLMRRSPNRWMTLVGDIAQTSSPAGVDHWADALGPYVDHRWELCELSVNYRTPATVARLSELLLAAIDPAARAPRTVRAGRRPVAWYEPAESGLAGVVTAELGRAEAGRAVAVLHPDPGEAGEGADGSWYASLAEVAHATRPDVSVLPVSQAKGLEFDVVVLVDPQAVLDRSPQGLQDLYVATSRATQELVVVQPGGLTGLLARARAAMT